MDVVHIGDVIGCGDCRGFGTARVGDPLEGIWNILGQNDTVVDAPRKARFDRGIPYVQHRTYTPLYSPVRVR